MNDVLVSANWLNDNLTNKNLIILDASLKTNISGAVSEFTNKILPGARYFDIDNVFSDTSNDLPHMLCSEEQFKDEARKLGINKNSLIVVYDNVGVYSSPRVYWIFKTFGHENIFVLNGGLPEWAENGYALEEKKTEYYKSGNLTPTLDKSSVRNIEEIKKISEDNSEIIIDARSAGRFNGTEPEPRDWISSGHIKGSLNLPFEDLLVKGKYKDKEKIKGIFSDLKLNGKPLVFSCGSGLTACILYLAADYIGLENKLSVYDGSWTEWAQSRYF